jgi:hypothetical protein
MPENPSAAASFLFSRRAALIAWANPIELAKVSHGKELYVGVRVAHLFFSAPRGTERIHTNLAADAEMRRSGDKFLDSPGG